MSVIFNITYTSAQPKKNATELEMVEWKNERAFYDLTADYNYVTYSLNGTKTAKHKDILDYMEKDTGAFNLERPLTEQDVNDIKERLAKSKSIIWHGFISFDKGTSAAFTTPEQARKFLKQTMGALFENSHIDKDNIEIMASLHTDRAHHHHIHFSFWEIEPKRLNKNGEIKFTQKGTFNHKCIDNFLIASSLALEDNKNDLHIARDKALARLKELMPQHKNTQSEIGAKLAEVASILPKSGRLGYSSDNMSVLREKIDRAVDFIVARDVKLRQFVFETYGEIVKRENRAQELAKANKIIWTQGGRFKPEEIEGKLSEEQKKQFALINKFACVEKLRPDFRARLGQVVINAAKGIKEKKIANMRSCRNAGKNAMKIAARRDAMMIRRDVEKFLFNLEQTTLKIRTDFTPLLHQAEFEIAQAQERKYK